MLCSPPRPPTRAPNMFVSLPLANALFPICLWPGLTLRSPGVESSCNTPLSVTCLLTAFLGLSILTPVDLSRSLLSRTVSLVPYFPDLIAAWPWGSTVLEAPSRQSFLAFPTIAPFSASSIFLSSAIAPTSLDSTLSSSFLKKLNLSLISSSLASFPQKLPWTLG